MAVSVRELLARGYVARDSSEEPRRFEGDPARAHTPVLVEELLAALRSQLGDDPKGWLVDGTLGFGGHTLEILRSFPGLSVLGTDRDPEALAAAQERLRPFGERVRLRRSRISGLSRLLRKEQIGRPLGLLLDLGVSSWQLDKKERGFSFLQDGPLDMRMDPDEERTAADIVNHWDEGDLADLFYYEGDERRARVFARAIVEARRRVPFHRTGALATVIAQAVGGEYGRIHPATRAFQALRRAVNEEGEELRAGLLTAEHWLEDGGLLLVISFHSGEDGAVQRFLKRAGKGGQFELQTRQPKGPSGAERSGNRRSRSARLRVGVRRRVPCEGEVTS